jgi:hypothetical protein
MGNRSRAIAHLFGVRAAGRKDNQSGKTFGGLYIPGYTNSAGVPVSARWTGNFFLNGAPWTNAQGQQQEGRRDVLSLTAWNGKNSANGRGMADLFAKIISPGLEISVDVEPMNYDGIVYYNGQPVTAPDGTVITTRKIGWRVVPGSLIIGQESAKFSNDQVAAGIRKPGWNVPGSPDQQEFRQMMAQHHNQVYQPGMNVYGYALVGQPKNAQANAYGNAGNGWGGQPGAWATPSAPAGWTTPAEPMVEGKTFEQWVAAGVSPAAMLGSNYWATLHEKARMAMAFAGASAGTATAATTGGSPY